MANIAFMDSGPEYDFVHALHERYGTDSPVTPTQMNKENSDWDILYPISSFLDTYRFELPPSPGFKWPEVGVKHKESRLEGKRKIDLTLDFVSLPVLLADLLFTTGTILTLDWPRLAYTGF